MYPIIIYLYESYLLPSSRCFSAVLSNAEYTSATSDWTKAANETWGVRRKVDMISADNV